MAKFFYCYYYVLFVYHQSINKKRPDHNPWIMTLLTISMGVSVPIIATWSFLLYTQKGPEVHEQNKWFGLVIMGTVFFGLYQLLFKYLNVSKDDGTTERFQIPYGKRIKIFFWVFWALSIVLPFVITGIVTPHPFRWI